MELLGEGLQGTVVNTNRINDQNNPKPSSDVPGGERQWLPWPVRSKSLYKVPWRSAVYGLPASSICSKAFQNATLPKLNHEGSVNKLENENTANGNYVLKGNIKESTPTKHTTFKNPETIYYSYKEFEPQPPKPNGLPQTPPLGRSEQLGAFIESMIDRSNTRGFLKQPICYPPPQARCVQETPGHSVPKIDQRCLDLKPTVHQQIQQDALAQRKVNEELDNAVRHLQRLINQRDVMFTDLARLETDIHLCKEQLYSASSMLQYPQTAQSVATKVVKLEQAQNNLVKQIRSMTKDIANALSYQKSLEDELTRMAISQYRPSF